MNAADVLMVAAVVVPLAEVVKYSKRVPDGWGVPVVMVLSALGVGLWGWSTPDVLSRANAWPLFAGWVGVVTTAAGVYGFIREKRDGVMDAERKP
ncbi:hypothetical protein [Luteitalea sp.]